MQHDFRTNRQIGEIDDLDQLGGSSEDLIEQAVPLTSFALQYDDHRQAFLGAFCSVGEPALFEAVSHIWSSLGEPREARCTAMGIAAGTGGKGKFALVRLLRACLDEVVTWGTPMPCPADHSSIEQWHEATMVAFEAERAREAKVCKRFSAILNGEIP